MNLISFFYTNIKQRFPVGCLTCVAHFRGVLTIFLLSLSLNLFAEAKVDESKQYQAEKTALTNSIRNHFDAKISDLDETLFKNQKLLTSNSEKLKQFVNEKVLPLWSSTTTLRLMVGSKRWKGFSKEQKSQLEQRFRQTFQRYLKRGMSFYDGQRIKVLSVQLKKKLKTGFLTTELAPIYLPRFNIMFKIAKIDDDWQLYDILIEGISYIKMKKKEYRRILHEQGFDALICHLDKKNGKKPTESLAKNCDTPVLGCNKVIASCG